MDIKSVTYRPRVSLIRINNNTQIQESSKESFEKETADAPLAVCVFGGDS